MSATGRDPAESPPRSGLVENAAAMLAVNVLQRAIGLVVVTLLARTLTPAGLGAYTFTQSTAQTFWGMLRLGIPAGLHARLARVHPASERDDAEGLLGECASLVLLVILAGALLLWLLPGPIAGVLFGAPELGPFVAIAGGLFVGQGLAQAAYAGFAGLHAFALHARITVAGSVAMAVAAVGGAFAGGAWGAAIGLVLGQGALVAALLAGLAGAMAVRGLRPSLRRPSARAASVLAIGLPFYGAGLFLIPAEFASLAAVSRLSGVEALGELRVVLALVAIVQVIPHALSGPLLSHLAARGARSGGAASAPGRSMPAARGGSAGHPPAAASLDPALIETALEQARALWAFALVTVAAVLVVWPFAILLVFGPGYPVALAEGHVGLAPLVPALVCTALTAALLAGGRAMPLLAVGAVQAAVLLGLAWPLVELAGLAGYFAAQALAATVAAVLSLHALGRQAGTRPFRWWMAPLLGLTLLLCAVLVADAVFAESGLQRLLAGAVLLPALAAGVAFAAFSGAERRTIGRRAAGLLLSFRRKAAIPGGRASGVR